MANAKVSLCRSCGACPEVEIIGDELRIGETGNVTVLKKQEWNVLVELIQSGQLGPAVTGERERGRIGVNDRLLRTGIVGSVIAALCCATPILAIMLGGMGPLAWMAWADYILIPALAVFLGIAAYALNCRRRQGS
jgi:mercuric ion transport protein